MNKFLNKLKNRENLSFEESKAAFEILMNGKASDNEIFDFLTFLSAKGEVSDEIAGGVYVLRNKAKKVNPKIKVGVCGEHGGDPQSIEFFNQLNFDYVSCSPFRVPIAILCTAKS